MFEKYNQLLHELKTQQQLTNLYTTQKQLSNELTSLSNKRQEEVRNGIDPQQTSNHIALTKIKLNQINKRIRSYSRPSIKSMMFLGPASVIKPAMNISKMKDARRNVYMKNTD
jgi:hypothetical protein